MSSNSPYFTVRLADDQRKWLVDESQKRRCGMSALVRQAIDLYIESIKKDNEAKKKNGR